FGSAEEAENAADLYREAGRKLAAPRPDGALVRRAVVDGVGPEGAFPAPVLPAHREAPPPTRPAAAKGRRPVAPPHADPPVPPARAAAGDGPRPAGRARRPRAPGARRPRRRLGRRRGSVPHEPPRGRGGCGRAGAHLGGGRDAGARPGAGLGGGPEPDGEEP